MEYDTQHNIFEAIHKPTGKVVSIFLTPEEIHLKKTLSCMIPIYLDNDGEIVPMYVNSDELEFIFDEDEDDVPTTKRTR